MAFIALLFTILTIVYLIKLCIKSIKLNSQFKQVPGPRPRLPILGNAYWAFDVNFFRKPLNKFLIDKAESLVSKYQNDGYAIGIFINRICLVIFKQKHASELFTKVHNKVHEFKLLREWLGDSIFFNEYKDWKSKRKLLNPYFRSSILNGHLSAVNNALNTFIDQIGIYSNEEYFDIKPMVYEWNLITILATLMGISPTKINDSCRSYVQNVDKAQQQFIYKMIYSSKLMKFFYEKSSSGRSLQKIIKQLNEFGHKVIITRKEEMKSENRPGGHSLLDQLLELQKRNPSISDEVIRAEVNTFVAAGFETSASSLLWLILLIANNDQIQEMLRTELRVVIGDKQRPITKDDISKLVYTECIIKETLRLYPVAHTILREAENDFFFDGHKYPKNTVVCILLFKSHRDKGTFRDADNFVPERFLNPATNASFHAFGGGNRDCIGKQFAMNSMKMFVAKLFLNYELKAKHTENEVKRNYLGVMRPDSKLLITARKIK